MAYVSTKEEMAVGRLVAEERRLREKHVLRCDPFFVLQSVDAEGRIVSIMSLNKIPEPNPSCDYINRFLTVSASGTLTMWHHFRRAADWNVNLRVSQVMHGILIPGLKPGEHPVLFIQSRAEGIRFYHFYNCLLIRPNWGVGEDLEASFETTPTELHSGFARMRFFSSPRSKLTDPILVFPDRLTNAVVFNRRYLDFINCPSATKQFTPCHVKEESMLMFLNMYDSKNKDIGVFLLYGLEDSTLNGATVERPSITELKIHPWPKTVMLNEMSGSTSDGFSGASKKEELCTPTCTVYGSEKSYLVVGTNIQVLFLFEVKPQRFRLLKKKRLMNPGISCMAMHDNQNLICTGGYDGMIRLFNLPELNQIVVIKYHVTLINDVSFVQRDRGEPHGKTYFLMAAAGKGQVTSWNLYPSVYYHNSQES